MKFNATELLTGWDREVHYESIEAYNLRSCMSGVRTKWWESPRLTESLCKRLRKRFEFISGNMEGRVWMKEVPRWIIHLQTLLLVTSRTWLGYLCTRTNTPMKAFESFINTTHVDWLSVRTTWGWPFSSFSQLGAIGRIVGLSACLPRTVSLLFLKTLFDLSIFKM